MRQVDDFTVSALSQTLVEDIISSIDDKMTLKFKSLGVITRFNGVNITQTRNFIKVHNKTYIDKDKNWFRTTIAGLHSPQYIPMHNNTE